MSNEVQEPDGTPDTKPESASNADAGKQLDKEGRERGFQTLDDLMSFLQWVTELPLGKLLKLFAVIAFAGFVWWLIHGGR